MVTLKLHTNVADADAAVVVVVAGIFYVTQLVQKHHHLVCKHTAHGGEFSVVALCLLCCVLYGVDKKPNSLISYSFSDSVDTWNLCICDISPSISVQVAQTQSHFGSLDCY